MIGSAGPEHAARGLEQQHDHQRADDEVGGARIARALDQIGLEHQW